MKDDAVQQILKKYDGTRGSLISTLEEIQNTYGYLPQQALYLVAEKTHYSLSDIYGVATFYKSFNLNPVGKHRISVCLGTACHVRLAPKVAEEFQKQLKITPGQTTKDREFTLETVNCLGACALGPVVMVDGHYFSHVTPNQVQGIINKARIGLDKVEIKTDQRVFPIEVSCSRCNHSLMESRHLIDGYPSIKVTISFGNKHGWMLLSCLYGSYTRESEYKIPDNTIVNFFCPHCHASLNSVARCPECQANMVPMIVKGGGIVQICSRNGCKGHMLDINGVNVNWIKEPALEEMTENRGRRNE
jgi:NADH-quinone oxidoreductase subunit E